MQTPGEVNLKVGLFGKCQRFFFFFLNDTPLLTSSFPVVAVEIYTSGALEAVNGTDVRLKCTFSSFAPVGDALTVTWNFRPRDGGREQFVSRFWSPSRGLLTRMHCGNLFVPLAFLC